MKDTGLVDGDVVGWSERALLRRNEFDRPYAALSRGVVVKAQCNGGWTSVVLWQWGERANDPADLQVRAITR